MAQTIYTLEAANIFCGDHDPTNSNHLTIQNLKLPSVEEQFSEHNAGGSPLGIEVETHIQRLEATFALVGITPQVMTLVGEYRRERQIFTAYGEARDRRTGRAIEVMAILEGRLGTANPTEFSKGNNFGTEYRIGGITRYFLSFDGTTLYDIDFYTSTRIIGGENLNEDMNRILRIPTTGV